MGDRVVDGDAVGVLVGVVHPKIRCVWYRRQCRRYATRDREIRGVAARLARLEIGGLPWRLVHQNGRLAKIGASVIGDSVAVTRLAARVVSKVARPNGFWYTWDVLERNI